MMVIYVTLMIEQVLSIIMHIYTSLINSQTLNSEIEVCETIN